MKKIYIKRIVKEELLQVLESCGYTHTTKGDKLKSPGGTSEEELKKEYKGIPKHKAKNQNYGGKTWQVFRNSLKGLSTSTKLAKLAASPFSKKLKDNYRDAMRRGGQVKKKGTSGKYIKEVNPVATGIKYMNKFNTSSAVGKINANDEDPSDNNSHKDYEGKMVRAQMRVINRYSKDIYNMIEDDAQLEAWVQSKLTKATDYIQSVKHYLRDYKQEKK
mgnify:CR=1 FL=1